LGNINISQDSELFPGLGNIYPQDIEYFFRASKTITAIVIFLDLWKYLYCEKYNIHYFKNIITNLDS